MKTILTERREAFCQHYFAHRDGPAAYRHAYNVRPETLDKSVTVKASGLLAEPDIAERLATMQAAADAHSPVVMDVARALAAWVEIATADPDELIGLRVGCCRYCHGEAFGYQWKQREYLAALDEYDRAVRRDPKGEYIVPDIGGGLGFRKGRPPRPDCPECEGEGVERVVPRDTSKLSAAGRALYGGVKQTRNGVEVIIADRTKALENVTRMLGGFNDRVRLDASLQTMLTVARLETTDPIEASRQYQRMIAANAA